MKQPWKVWRPEAHESAKTLCFIHIQQTGCCIVIWHWGPFLKTSTAIQFPGKFVPMQFHPCFFIMFYIYLNVGLRAQWRPCLILIHWRNVGKMPRCRLHSNSNGVIIDNFYDFQICGPILCRVHALQTGGCINCNLVVGLVTWQIRRQKDIFQANLVWCNSIYVFFLFVKSHKPWYRVSVIVARSRNCAYGSSFVEFFCCSILTNYDSRHHSDCQALTPSSWQCDGQLINMKQANVYSRIIFIMMID